METISDPNGASVQVHEEDVNLFQGSFGAVLRPSHWHEDDGLTLGVNVRALPISSAP